MRIWLILGTILVAVVVYIGCQTNAVPTAPGLTSPRFVGADVCSACHIKIGGQWTESRHHDALTDLLASSHHSDSCTHCHVVSLDDNPANGGYDDPNPLVAAKFGGVQCENCHGPGGSHIHDYIPLESPLASDVCGTCHASAHYPTYTEWETSLHATANLEWQNSSHFTTECQQCHSADYIFAASVPEDAEAEDFVLGITCIVCHDPHSTENPFQLRAPIPDICGRCHTDEQPVPGESVHHSTVEMYRGVGGYQFPGEIYVSSYHTTIEEACVACHMYTAPFEETTNTAISGHTFKPRLEACQPCHQGLDTFDKDGVQTTIQGLLDQLKAKLDAATANDKKGLSYLRAKFNYDFVLNDGSTGVHNFNYAQKLLHDSLSDFVPGT